MKLTKTYSYKFSAVYELDSIKSLIEYLESAFPNSQLKISGFTEDDSIIDFITKEELYNYEDPDFKRLKGIRFIADDKEKFIKLTLGKGQFSYEFNSYEIGYNDLNWGIPVEDTLKKRLNEFKIYYSFIYNIPPLTLFLPMLLFISVLSIMGVQIIAKLIFKTSIVSNDVPTQSTLNETESAYMAWFTYGLLFLVGLLLDRLKKYLFPRSFFLIGKQVKRYGRIKRWRDIVIVVIGLGILISIISNYISAQIGMIRLF